MIVVNSKFLLFLFALQ